MGQEGERDVGRGVEPGWLARAGKGPNQKCQDGKGSRALKKRKHLRQISQHSRSNPYRKYTQTLAKQKSNNPQVADVTLTPPYLEQSESLVKTTG